MIITIDGPSGTGKSTVAQKVAKKLGYTYFNTGATYRSLTWFFLKHKIDVENVSKVEKALSDFRAGFVYNVKENSYTVSGVDITSLLSSQEITSHVSQIAAYPYVRSGMVPIQRDFEEACNNCVFEGRDIGTVVFPEAEVKIFLTASPEERAKRRLKDFEASGDKIAYEEVLKAIKERDYRDIHRKVAPLKQADDATVVDTTELTLDQAVNEILRKVKEAV